MPQRNLLIYTILFVLLLIAGWQYTLFKEDNRKLSSKLHQLQSLSASLNLWQRFPIKISIIDKIIAKLATEIPIGDYLNEHFIKAIRTSCLLNSTTFHLYREKKTASPSYGVYDIGFKIYGSQQAVSKVLKEIQNQKRIVNWVSICKRHSTEDTMGVVFSLKIYNLHPVKIPPLPTLNRPLAQSRTWLPPFSWLAKQKVSQIQILYEKIMATPRMKEKLQLENDLFWKRSRLMQIEELVKLFNTSRTTLDSLLTSLSSCQ